MPSLASCVTNLAVDHELKTGQSLMLHSNYPLDVPKFPAHSLRENQNGNYNWIEMAINNEQLSGMAYAANFMPAGSKISFIGLREKQDEAERTMKRATITIDIDFGRQANLDEEEVKLRVLCEKLRLESQHSSKNRMSIADEYDLEM